MATGTTEHTSGRGTMWRSRQDTGHWLSSDHLDEPLAVLGRRDANVPDKAAPQRVRVGKTATLRHLFGHLLPPFEPMAGGIYPRFFDLGRGRHADFAPEQTRKVPGA